jgi:hypothetical protein
MKKYAYKITFLSVFTSYHFLNLLVDFYESQYGGHTTEDDLDIIIFNPVISTTPKWQTLKLLRWMQICTSQM